MRPMRLTFLTALAVALGSLGCQEDLEAISQVTKFRVLGVQTDPPELGPGESTKVRALTADPEGNGRLVIGIGFAQAGLFTPNSDITEGSELSWFLDPTPANANGVISFPDELGVPVDIADYFPDDGDDDPANDRLQVTATILLCAGDGFEVAALFTALDDLFDPSAEPEDEGTEGSESSLLLQEKCVEAGADEGLVAFKTFTISAKAADDPLRNTNPEIAALTFEEEELTPLAAEPLVFECEGKDGCRDSAELVAFLTPESYQQQEVEQFGEIKLEDERTYISWFIDGGSFSDDRSGTNDPEAGGPFEVKWIPPREGGEDFTLWAVAHDIRGGVSWEIYRVSALVVE